jgi:SAM-dependent methyltransferase
VAIDRREYEYASIMDNDARRQSPAAERNRGPILAELQRLLPMYGLALEIASGTGQHAAHFANNLPGWRWLPSDGDARALASIAAWCEGVPNALPPLQLDVLAEAWPGVPVPVDAVFCANLLHISPWTTCAALMKGAARHLSPDGLLLLYGPYLVDGEATAPSNLAFDADLRSRDARWGLRRLSDVSAQAEAAGLRLRERIAMPANNLLLAWARVARGRAIS